MIAFEGCGIVEMPVSLMSCTCDEERLSVVELDVVLAGKNSYAPHLHGPPCATIDDVPSTGFSSAIIKSQAVTISHKVEDIQTLMVYLV